MNKLQFCFNELTKMVNSYPENLDCANEIAEQLAYDLGVPHLEPLIYKLSYVELNNEVITHKSLNDWNIQLYEEFETLTTESELDELYNSIQNNK